MMRTNLFERMVIDRAMERGLSRRSVLCALLMSARSADIRRIAPIDYDAVFDQLAVIPSDVAASAAFNNLCQCVALTHYDVVFNEAAEKHAEGCRYVLWRILIDDPLPSVLDEEELLDAD